VEGEGREGRLADETCEEAEPPGRRAAIERGIAPIYAMGGTGATGEEAEVDRVVSGGATGRGRGVLATASTEIDLRTLRTGRGGVLMSTCIGAAEGESLELEMGSGRHSRRFSSNSSGEARKSKDAERE
jgi:hypothetical protein